jgi:uncharacterized protein YdaU (DUF1376 family)
VNYFEDHIGDYAAATAHLSWDEDMAYTRLIRAYYHHEKPIPADLKAACRIARAQTTGQREAVKTVLDEFFTLQEDGWHQKRCDAEIARYQDKQEKARRSAATRWNAKQPQSAGNANASPDAMRTHTEGNAPSLQTPDTRPKERESALTPDAVAPDPAEARAPSNPEPEPQGTQAGAVCKAMRKAGLSSTNPGDPRLLTLLQQGATEAEFVGLAAEAAEKRKGWAWVLSVLQARRAEASEIALAPRPEDAPKPWQETADGIKAKGAELGMRWSDDGWVNGECIPFPTYRARVLRAAGVGPEAAA